MPNKNYVKGRAFEYRVKHYLENAGFYVMRAYGSKGLFDLIAVPPSGIIDDEREAWMIQCKTNGYLRPAERDALWKAAADYAGNVKLATKDEKGHLLFKAIV